MATPAPHVPVSFLLAGGVHAFSEACIKAMLACDIHPDMVGSYSAVASRNANARQAVRAYEQAIREGRERPPPEPTFAQRWMACSTAGHLTQDAAHVASGGRGNNCATLVDGYTENGAPAMSTLGTRSALGTVEADVSAMEERQATERRAAATPPGNMAYPANDRRADEQARIATAVGSHDRYFPDGLKARPMNTAPVGSPFDRRAEEGRRAAANRARRAPPGTAMASPNAPAPAAAAGEPQVKQVEPTHRNASPQQQTTECLQNYRDAMMTPEARRAALDQEIRRQQTDPAAQQNYEDERDRQDRSVANMRTQEQGARNHETQARQTRDRAAARNAQTPSPKRAAALSSADEALREAQADTTAAQQRTQEAQARRAAAEDLRPAQQVACLQAQRARLGTPAERTEGRIPGPNGT